ncbi:hypothetical protein AB0L75_05595 [Streptomyces sp. NPDC052101]|uniref:hypothetical protein n=1 Tax=Streptomyces sp. NPDC052101 TaxID=3155763 RepID=UPI00343207FE
MPTGFMDSGQQTATPSGAGAIKRENGDSHVTKGDANRTPAPGIVPPQRLVGVVSAVIPYVGSVWL